MLTMNVYKITDILQCEFLKIPKAMFAHEKYRRLSSDAKLAFALLYDRLSLSKLNGWINQKDEVYLIYTRKEIAKDLGITYKKAISAFKELVTAGLIAEKRCGRGLANRIYIAKPELDAESVKTYIKRENARTADSAYLTESVSPTERSFDTAELPQPDIKTCQSNTSRTAQTEVTELPNPQTNKTYRNRTYENHTNDYRSIRRYQNHMDGAPPFLNERTDGIYSLDEILENCQLESFEEEERKILYDALERLFYSENLKIGGAVLPRQNVRSRMYEIDSRILESALEKLHRNDKPIKNITGYVMSTIFNCITEEYSLLHIDPYLNSLREVKKE